MAELRPNRTLGPGHDTFWDWCNKGELRLQRCTACSEMCWPVVQTCECCGNDQFVWDRMSGNGKIVSWCTFERDYYNDVLPIPWETILVELEEGPLFISNPHGFTWQDISFNLSVKLTFIESEDKAGSFMLPVFSRV
jgi:uncharacterized OB-fold protein